MESPCKALWRANSVPLSKVTVRLSSDGKSLNSLTRWRATP